ncbi:protein FAR1-RELATED SEQUENCE 1-like [Lotus japonicus]|uniref:protein FAR1-RELATED SEQUENCE 1-like n=1 Tax=Lotus japonicus TaxID=34305 RepID=UPI00258460D2|nr:protein FAR1-RELATED SEQUENCE 1-like [Lotus japonicus]
MEEDWKPKVDMIFDSFEDAWKFWVDYGGKVGFGVRKQYTHHNKSGSIATCRFVCCKEGLRKPDKRDYKTINARPETKTGCKARLGLKNLCGKLIVHDFIEEHNHILHLQETTHMLSSQRKVSEVQCHQIDVADDAGLQQRKTFDLMSKQVGDSFKWLFEKFLEAHKQKTPQTVFTNQDQAMMKALAEVMPGAYHGLCTWHLMQNGIKYLGNLMKGKSHFLTDFQKCMYGYEDEEKFEEGWRTLLAKFDVEENAWLQRMYTMKEKWAYCHMKKTFSLGMRSTQISESVNAEIKGFTNVNLDIIKFFKRFEDVGEEKRYNELKCEYEARQKIPKLKNIYSNILKQVSELYTPTIFDIFQKG